MARTYLQLVNDVLTNLRENNVATLTNATPYTKLIAGYVNQAKEKVEDAWTWRALTVAANITTVTGQQSYKLDGTDSATITFSPDRVANDRSYTSRDQYGLANVIATLTGSVVTRLTEWEYESLIWNIRAVVVLVNQPPYAFAYSPVAGVPTLLLARPPDSAYNIECRMCVPQDVLSADNDNLIVPYRPVTSFATYLAMNERGEELGSKADMYGDLFQDELTRAINGDVEASQLQLQNN